MKWLHVSNLILCDHNDRRVWQVWSVVAGADVSWGLVGGLSRLLNVSLAELEGEDALRWDMPAAHRYEETGRGHRHFCGLNGVMRALTYLSRRVLSFPASRGSHSTKRAYQQLDSMGRLSKPLTGLQEFQQAGQWLIGLEMMHACVCR